MATIKLSEVMKNVRSAEWMSKQDGEVLNRLLAYADRASGLGKTKEAQEIVKAISAEDVRRAKVVAETKKKTIKKPVVEEKVAEEIDATLKKGDRVKMAHMGEGKKMADYTVHAVVKLSGDPYYLLIADSEDDYLLGKISVVKGKTRITTVMGFSQVYHKQ